jgi:TctA family transporter
VYTRFFKFQKNIVLVGILIFSMIGSYALRNSLFDVTLMLIFGILGFFMEKTAIPLPPLILGLILGPMIEENLRIGLVKSDGSFWPFFARPISLFFFCLLVFLFLYEPGKKLFRSFFTATSDGT